MERMEELIQGAAIKQYTLERLLGQGASGEVWLVTDNQRQAAMKFMNAALLRSANAAKHRLRMEREVKALTTLQHPNIPQLYDYDLNHMPPYLVMQYIDGPSFDNLIADGSMFQVPVKRRLELLRTVASALTTAHEAGIIHRDIKPGNINGIEKPYLLDFSIAVEEENIENTNRRIGTTIYMTPDEEPPDRLADNYSFALVAYEVLFGTHPIFPPDDKTRAMGAYTRLQAYNRLKNKEWRYPSKVAADQLPYDLTGADLKRLDYVFEKAFGARDRRYVDLMRFVEDLTQAILIPANEQYLYPQGEQVNATLPVPMTPGAATPIVEAEGFTKLEVERTLRKVEPPPPPATPDKIALDVVAHIPRADDDQGIVKIAPDQPNPLPNPSLPTRWIAAGIGMIAVVVLIVLVVVAQVQN
jgi:serine/threonine protein kinase